MRILVRKTYREVSQTAASLVAETLAKNPAAVLGLATGSTPLGLYGALVTLYSEGRLDFSEVTTFNLDEYLGLAGDHHQSYRRFMDHNLFDHINIDKARTHVPDGSLPAEQLETHCDNYEKAIRQAGGIDLQVLGIGGNGHIAFNEPGSSFVSRTRLVSLDEQTIQDNARFYDSEDQVPRFALTMGVGTILEAGEIILLATGEKKAPVVASAIEGSLTSRVPASALQMHGKVTVILDEEAAACLGDLARYRSMEKSGQEIGIKLY